MKTKTYGVYVNGELVEGGFFSRQAAIECAQRLTENNSNDKTGTVVVKEQK